MDFDEESLNSVKLMLREAEECLLVPEVGVLRGELGLAQSEISRLNMKLQEL